MTTIKSIYGPEPLREGEMPDAYVVGYAGVTRIETRDQNLAEYGIQWFDVFKGDELHASQNARYVASIVYAAPVAS